MIVALLGAMAWGAYLHEFLLPKCDRIIKFETDPFQKQPVLHSASMLQVVRFLQVAVHDLHAQRKRALRQL